MPEPRQASSRYHHSLSGAARERCADVTGSLELAGYELIEILSSGRTTEVWRARATNGDCVVKLPVAALAGDRGAARLIEREWEFLERAAQPGVVRALDRFDARTGPALVTEFLPGGSLVALAGSHPRRWAQALLDVVEVVAELHRRGIVHRDLKPANVLFDARDRATLVDFALATAIGSGSIGGGTSAYRAEALSSAPGDEPGDDVHALAVTAYELLCGRLPFGQAPAGAVSAAMRRSALERLEDAAAELGALGGTVRDVLGQVPADAAGVLADFRRALQAIITID